VPEDRLTNLVGALTLVVADAVRHAVETAAGHSDAAPAALAILQPARHGRSVDELRRAVGLTPSGGVRLVDRLVADRLVQRRPGADGRSVLVTLTPRGRRTVRAILTARAVAIDQILRPLTTEQRADLEELVEELLSGQTVERIEARRSGIDYPGGWTCRLCDQRACGRDRGTCPTANAARDLATAAEVPVSARKPRA
jgi:DNA-binding MarR family transcriptional regulator